MSFTDSFLDFEAIKNWFESVPSSDMTDGEKADIKVLEVDSCQEIGAQELALDGSSFDVIAVGKECEAVENLSLSIEEDLGKVSLIGEMENTIDICESDSRIETVDVNENKIEVVSRESPMNVVCESGLRSETNDVINEDKCEPVTGESPVKVADEIGMDSESINGIGKKQEMVSGESENLNIITGESSTKCETYDGNGEKTAALNDEDKGESSESESASTSSASSSSSSSSSSDDNEEDEDESESEENDDGDGSDLKAEVKGGTKAQTSEEEEGEIRDQHVVADDDDGDDDDAEAMIACSEEDDEEDDGIKGPIRSRNEAEVLPPVPQVDATLLPHHQIQPVGVILSIVGTQVVVEGIEKHNPLSDGSILWISDTRSPLGLVDEIFGPVKNPYYVVRFNSEAEVPAGIGIGTLISFVPEFASHVLDNKDIHKKGYDASGAFDEELSDDGEFSDDEKEAEFRRTLKASKRGTSDPAPRKNKSNRKGFESRSEPQRSGLPSPQESTMQQPGSVPPNHYPPHHQQFSPFPTGPRPMWPNAPQNGVWSNSVPFQQPQGMFFPNGFPTNYMPPWPPQNFQPQNPYPMPNNAMPYNQQFTISQNITSLGPGQNYLWGLRQPSPSNLNIGEQGMGSNGLVMGQDFNMPQSGGAPGTSEAPRQFNPNHPGRGRGSFSRGGGRFSRGRGRRQ